MTLQDFLVSSLPSANVENKAKIEQQSVTTIDQSDNESNRAKHDKTLSTASTKPSAISSKRIQSCLRIFFIQNEFHRCF